MSERIIVFDYVTAMRYEAEQALGRLAAFERLAEMRPSSGQTIEVYSEEDK